MLTQLFSNTSSEANNFVDVPKSEKIKIFGRNNKIKINKNMFPGGSIYICIYGNDNNIELKSCGGYNLSIDIGDATTSANHTEIIVEEGTNFNGTHLLLMEDNSHIYIGKDCMFSWDIEVDCSDTHTITDLQGHVLNRGQFIEIGDHVWVCKRVTILKNSRIGANSVIACNSCVSKSFEDNNCVIGGNPAKILKQNINWDRHRINDYIKVK